MPIKFNWLIASVTLAESGPTTRKEFRMRVLLFGLAILAALIGGTILAAAESAIHEIEAFILFLIAAVLASGAAVVEAVNLLRKDLTSRKGKEPASSRKRARNP